MLNQAFQSAPQQSLANDFGNLGISSQPQNNPAPTFDTTPTQQQQAQKKKDLWDTDLVSLNPSDAFTGNQKKGGMGGQSEFDSN